MIIATVITCPRRWPEYQRLRRNFAALNLSIPLRTFQTSECLQNPLANNSLNARAALGYADRHLPPDGVHWLLYLEDDVALHTELAQLLPWLTATGETEKVDCWYLCNRKNPVVRQWRGGGAVINELGSGLIGSHALLLPRRHLRRILDAHWGTYSDQCLFRALWHAGVKVWQVVKPVLVEHLGAYSTFVPNQKQTLEVNDAIGTDHHSSAG